MPLRLIPQSAQVPILLGPSKGLKWVVGSGAHGYWVGIYEFKKRRIIQQILRPGDVFYDIGAHVGYFTLVASCLVGDEGFVLAVEPDPGNAMKLLEHLELNGISNVKLIRAASSDTGGGGHFSLGANTFTGHLTKGGPLAVDTVTIDGLIKDYPPPSVLKIDAEGAELDILIGAEETLTSVKPIVILSTHGQEQEIGTRKVLETKGYRVEPLPGVPEEFIAFP